MPFSIFKRESTISHKDDNELVTMTKSNAPGNNDESGEINEDYIENETVKSSNRLGDFYEDIHSKPSVCLKPGKQNELMMVLEIYNVEKFNFDH